MLHDLNGFLSYRELVLDLNLSVVNKFSFSWLVLYFLRAILCVFWHCASVQVTHTHTPYVYHSNFLKQLLFPYVTNKKISTLREVKQHVKGHSARKRQNQNSALTPLLGNPIGKNGVRWHEVSTRHNSLEEWLGNDLYLFCSRTLLQVTTHLN